LTANGPYDASWLSARANGELQADVVMSNNFAFGGVNTSLLFRKFV
jgi:3-oxoacyl-(acyl-carrier-protein) synthase